MGTSLRQTDRFTRAAGNEAASKLAPRCPPPPLGTCGVLKANECVVPPAFFSTRRGTQAGTLPEPPVTDYDITVAACGGAQSRRQPSCVLTPRALQQHVTTHADGTGHALVPDAVPTGRQVPAAPHSQHRDRYQDSDISHKHHSTDSAPSEQRKEN